MPQPFAHCALPQHVEARGCRTHAGAEGCTTCISAQCKAVSLRQHAQDQIQCWLQSGEQQSSQNTVVYPRTKLSSPMTSLCFAVIIPDPFVLTFLLCFTKTFDPSPGSCYITIIALNILKNSFCMTSSSCMVSETFQISPSHSFKRGMGGNRTQSNMV